MKLSIVAAMAAFIQPAIALANPTWSERLTGAAVGGAHILITHAYVGSEPGSTIATFYGTSHSDWFAGTDTSADTGSGTRTLSVRQICDCHVPVNTQLHYKLNSSWGYSYGGPVDIMGSEYGTGGSCAAPCAAADARDAAVPADGPSPEIADATTPPSTEDARGNGGATGSSGASAGAVSTAVATGGATGSGGASAPVSSVGSSSSGGSTSVTTTAATSEKVGGGACTLAPSPRSSALPALWVLAAFALAVARRRRP
jgi:hypothetical protein